MNARKNATESKRLDRLIEQNEGANEDARWEQARLAHEATSDGEVSQRQYADIIDKHRSTVQRWVAVWQEHGECTRHQRPRFADAYASVESGERTASESARLKRERTVPTRHEDRVEMVEKLLADPDVAEAVIANPSLASRQLTQAVHLKDSHERERARAAAQQKREDGALPLSAFMSAMIVKIDEWSRELGLVESELPYLRDGRDRDLVYGSLVRLEQKAHACVEAMREPADVIDLDIRRSSAATIKP